MIHFVLRDRVHCFSLYYHDTWLSKSLILFHFTLECTYRYSCQEVPLTQQAVGNYKQNEGFGYRILSLGYTQIYRRGW